uniref:Integrase catalytic domain-containing protein n=1 Tax=Rhodnius prolixus TaxID=13249 RepID=T1HDF1_RHOPR
MTRDVERYVKSCQSCNERKSPSVLAVPLGRENGATYPFELVSLDVVECPLSSRGNRYLLTMVDHFTRYAEVVAMRTQTAEETARAF